MLTPCLSKISDLPNLHRLRPPPRLLLALKSKLNQRAVAAAAEEDAVGVVVLPLAAIDQEDADAAVGDTAVVLEDLVDGEEALEATEVLVATVEDMGAGVEEVDVDVDAVVSVAADTTSTD